MLSLLPSTQLLLALWLLAALAPAATALLNGSVMPFGVAESRVKVSARESGSVLAVEARTAENDLSLNWLAPDAESGMESIRAADASPVASVANAEVFALRDSSVLQTDLQRHRPKAA